jgi:cyclic pyranopterin phosphate synthase
MTATDIDVAEVIQFARLTGIQAAKQTANLVPLCHPLALDHVLVDVVPNASGLQVLSEVVTTGRTGVEMEALTASMYCALSLMDFLESRQVMCRLSELSVLEKTGGKSDWGREVSSST